MDEHHLHFIGGGEKPRIESIDKIIIFFAAPQALQKNRFRRLCHGLLYHPLNHSTGIIATKVYSTILLAHASSLWGARYFNYSGNTATILRLIKIFTCLFFLRAL